MAIKGQRSGLDRTQNPERAGHAGTAGSPQAGSSGRRTPVPRPLGAVPVYDHPSAGQVASALGNALSLGTGGVAGLLGGVVGSDEYGRSPWGRALDALTGGVPEAPSRWAAPPTAPNLDARGEPRRRLDQDPAKSLTSSALDADPRGAGLPNPSEERPDIMLRDRRRGTSLYAGTDLLTRRP